MERSIAQSTSVLFVVAGLSYGGAENQVVQLAKHLKNRGWKIKIVSIFPPKAFMNELEQASIPVLQLEQLEPNKSIVGIIHAISKITKTIKKEKPDIVHSHMYHTNIITRVCRLFTSMPVLVCTAHSTYEASRRTRKRREFTLRELAYLLTDPLCNVTTQISKVGMERYIRVKATPRRKIRMVYNGVDTDRFSFNAELRKKARMDLGCKDEFVWISIARFEIVKDHACLLNSFRLVLEQEPRALLALVGSGPLQNEMKVLACNLGIDANVHFLGIRNDTPSLLSAADGYVMSSKWEGLPLTLLEAAATSLPIVATQVGGNGEIIVNGVSGILVPPTNPEALSKAMIQIMDLSSQKRREMGNIGRLLIEDKFAMGTVVSSWENLYLELLQKKQVKN